MRSDYKNWLESQKYSSGTVTAQIHRVGRVENYYGSLDDHYKRDNLTSVQTNLAYSTQDERRNRPNPSKIPIDGNLRANLASYRDAVKRYATFLGPRDNNDEFVSPEPLEAFVDRAESVSSPDNKLSLERDMQAALRRDIKQLIPTLTIIDDGAERSVETGFIDITCEDLSDKAIVAVELKAGKADARAIAQLLGYLGDLLVEEPGRKVRGILIAHEFDKRTVSAARAANISLQRYSVEFRFELLPSSE